MYQKLIIVGNLGRDPEMRYFEDGTGFASFSVATNRRWTNASGETQEETIWFNVSMFGKRAETAQQYLSKGQRVLIEGRLRPDPQTNEPRLWTDKDGNTHASYDVTAMDFRFMSTKEEADALRAQAGGGDGEAAQEEEEIPF